MSTAEIGTDVGTWGRQRAWELHQAGWWQKDIAVALGVSCGAVSQWIKRGREGGVEALRTRPRRGGPAKLTAEQRAQILGLLACGAPAYGFRGDGWTAKRIAEVIWRTFGVRYHRDHVSRLLRQAGLERAAPDPAGHPTRRGSHPPLARRALARHQNKAVEEGYTIVWVDESAFYWLPHCARTWAPKGETPALHVKLTHDHLSAISGITLDGRLVIQVQEAAFDSEGVVGFLRIVLRTIPGKVLVIWDGSPIHKGQPIKDYLARRAAKRLHLERLPGYAPDLNPDEGIWNYWKRVELKNRCCADLAEVRGELRGELRRAKERLRHKRHIIRSCSTQCGY